MKYIKVQRKIIAREYWGNRAVGVFVFCKETKRFLAVKRSPNVYEPNTWSFVISGKIDGDETDLEAARREFHEETEHHDLELLSKPQDVFKDGDFTFTTYIGIVDKEFKPEFGWETSDYKWCSAPQEVPTPRHFGTTRLLKKSDRWIKKLKEV